MHTQSLKNTGENIAMKNLRSPFTFCRRNVLLLSLLVGAAAFGIFAIDAAKAGSLIGKSATLLSSPVAPSGDPTPDPTTATRADQASGNVLPAIPDFIAGDDDEELAKLLIAAAELKESRGSQMTDEELARYESIWIRIREIQAAKSTVADAPTTNTTFPGTLTVADPTFNRPVNCSALSGVGTAVRYDVIPVTLACPTSVTVSTEIADGGSITPNGTGTAGPDMFMVLYGTGGFNPASPLTNCLAVNDDISGAANRRSRIVSASLPAGSYTAVLTSFNNVPTTTTDDAALPWTYTVALNDACVAPPTLDFGDAPTAAQ